MKREIFAFSLVLLLYGGQILAGTHQHETGQADGPSAQRETEARSAWARKIALTHEFLVQLAVKVGVDSRRAEQMRAVYASFRSFRDETLSLLQDGKIDGEEMQKRARQITKNRNRKLKALLSPAEYDALDEDEASFLTTLFERRLYKGKGLVPKRR